jgi:hypothetical protein
MTTVLERLSAALADGYAIERELSGPVGWDEYRISNTEYRNRGVLHDFNIPCSIFEIRYSTSLAILIRERP